MVKVTKVAVWKIGPSYIEDAKAAEKEARRLIIREMMKKARRPRKGKDEADWVGDNWDEIERRTKAAMTGT